MELKQQIFSPRLSGMRGISRSRLIVQLAAEALARSVLPRFALAGRRRLAFPYDGIRDKLKPA